MNTPFKGEIAWLPDFIGEELTKQANELLTKAAEAKKAAEKL